MERKDTEKVRSIKEVGRKMDGGLLMREMQQIHVRAGVICIRLCKICGNWKSPICQRERAWAIARALGSPGIDG